MRLDALLQLGDGLVVGCNLGGGGEVGLGRLVVFLLLEGGGAAVQRLDVLAVQRERVGARSDGLVEARARLGG